jgi:transposase
MVKPARLLRDEQWEEIKPLLPQVEPGPKGGRPRVDNRDALEGILWILRTGARWQDLPEKYPSASTCWRRLKEWEEEGIWLNMWRAFLSKLDSNGALDWQDTFIDSSFASSKKGAIASGRPRKARARSGWWWSTARVLLWEAPLPRHHQPK